MTQHIRVLVVDDHPLIVEGLTSNFPKFGIDVVADAASTSELLVRYAECNPDVVVLDIGFGHTTTGLDVAHELLSQHPQARIVFYSQHDQDDLISEVYRLGGFGFVSKLLTTSDLAEAVSKAHQGKVNFRPEIAERLALLSVRGDNSPRAKLNKRELEVFCAIANGRTQAEIAEELDLSVKTIGLINQAIKDKLGVQRPADIARLAVKYRIVEP
jgi:two-component system, NarL family, invasion response regulator UvrY